MAPWRVALIISVFFFGMGYIAGSLSENRATANSLPSHPFDSVEDITPPASNIACLSRFKTSTYQETNLLPEWVREDLSAAGVSGPLTEGAWQKFIEETERKGMRRFEKSLGIPLACAVARIPSLTGNTLLQELISDHINATDASGLSALAHAVMDANPKTIDTLITMGANPNLTYIDRKGKEIDLLNLALRSRSSHKWANVEHLLSNGFSLDPPERYYFDLVNDPAMASRYLPGMLETMDMNTRLDENFSALEYGLRSNLSPKLVDRFLDNGVDLTHTSDDGLSVLQGVCLSKNVHNDQVKRMISMGADVNAVSAVTGQTPLHYAVRYNRPELVKLYLSHGAKPEVKDRRGLRPEDELDSLERKGAPPHEIAVLRDLLNKGL